VSGQAPRPVAGHLRLATVGVVNLRDDIGVSIPHQLVKEHAIRPNAGMPITQRPRERTWRRPINSLLRFGDQKIVAEPMQFAKFIIEKITPNYYEEPEGPPSYQS
jgi:hypothetical protein